VGGREWEERLKREEAQAAKKLAGFRALLLICCEPFLVGYVTFFRLGGHLSSVEEGSVDEGAQGY
jgi:hypothetical protein